MVNKFKTASILCAVGVVLLLLRFAVQVYIGVPAGDSVWRVDWKVHVDVTEPPVSIRFKAPMEGQQTHVVKQELTYPRFKIKRGTNREIVAVAANKGQYTLRARYLVQLYGREEAPNTASTPSLTASQRELYLISEPEIQTDSAPVKKKSAELIALAKTENDLIELIFQNTVELVTSSSSGQLDDAESVLRAGRGSELGKARAMVALCRAQNIPARLITGFKLVDDLNARPSHWTDVFNGDAWVPYDPTRGHKGVIPAHYLAVRHDGLPRVFTIEGSATSKTEYQILQEDVPAGKFGSRERRLRDLFDLSRLSLDMRDTLALILMLPFGVLLTFAFRQLTGLPTYGTFTPSLLALAALYADPITTLIIFSVITVIGFFGRAAAAMNRLTRLPRLAVVITLVALAMALAVSVMDYFYLNPMGHVVLLPIVVLATFVDRLYKTLEDLGVKQVVIRLFTTALVTLGCFLLFGIETLADWIVNYPETHFITLAVVLLLSTYKSKKLIDIQGLDWLATEKQQVMEK